MSESQYISGFNRDFFRLFTILKALLPNDGQVLTYEDLARTAKRSGPEDTLVMTVGPYLYDYREQIVAGDFEYFLSQKNVKEVDQGNDDIKRIFQKLYGVYPSLTSNDKKRIRDVVVSMLENYLLYKTTSKSY